MMNATVCPQNLIFNQRGQGDPPIYGSTVQVRYMVWANEEDEKVPMESGDPKDYTFVLGEDATIEVVSSAVQLMPVGSIVTFDIKCNVAFGPLGMPAYNVATDTLLSFHLELVSAIPPIEKEKLDIETLKKQAIQYKEDGNNNINTNPDISKSAYLRAISLFSDISPSSADLNTFLIPYYTNLAQCEINTTNVNAALAFSNHVLQMEPQNGKAHYRCGQAYELSRQLPAAIWHFEQSAKFAPAATTTNKVRKLKDKQAQEREKKQKHNMWAGMFQTADSLNKIL